MERQISNEGNLTPDADVCFSPVLLTATRGYEHVVINTLYQHFLNRYGNCPRFFEGTLQEACQIAFISEDIRERRPILVCIFDYNNLLSRIFCTDTFCSEKISNYLNDNYIVWPWNIEFKSNRQLLTEMWEHLFSIQFLNDFNIGQYPLLFGIRQSSPNNIDECITSKYHAEVLLQPNIIRSTEQSVNPEILLDELRTFKTEFYENEETLFLSTEAPVVDCNFIIEIAKYLSLNEAIKAFSPKIIPHLKNSQLKFQLFDPSDSFLRIILQKFEPQQIVSLKLTGDKTWSTINLNHFTNIISITLLNLPYEKQINEYLKNLPNLIHISLYYDYEIDFFVLQQICIRFPNQIKRLEIHSGGIICSHKTGSENWLNSTLKYFLFDLGLIPLNLSNNCLQSDKTCFLTTVINFIKRMSKIQYLHLIINHTGVEQFMDEDRWINLVSLCSNLKKIRIEIMGNTDQKEELTEQALSIQNILRYTRQKIRFQLKFT